MNIVFDEFEKVDKITWIAKINKDLRGTKQASDMKYIIEGGLSIDPFLTSEDQKNRQPLDAPITKSGFKIDTFDSSDANKIGIKMLENGAQAIWFKIDKHTDFNILFGDIHLEMITTILDLVEADSEILLTFSNYIDRQYKNTSLDIIIKGCSSTGPFTDILTILKKQDKILDRLVELNEQFVEVLEHNQESKLAIIVELKTDFLAQIAEIRAIRVLWANLKEMVQNSSASLKIICEVVHDDQKQNDINPLIKYNYQMMSAYLGTADLVFGPSGIEDLEQARLILNIQNIFKEEAGLVDVIDPTAGSYFIEELTDQMVLKSWEMAQQTI